MLICLNFGPGLDLGPESLTPETFPLPHGLHSRLRQVSHDVHNGRGFCIVRGLDIEALTDEESVLVYAGISSHVAPVRGFQDKERKMVTCRYGHIEAMYSSDTRNSTKRPCSQRRAVPGG